MNTRFYRSYAKINLYLDVLDRRPDGFTNIETVLQSIDLWDGLTFTLTESGTAFTCSDPSLADPAENLVCRAVDLLRTHTGSARGVAIHLDKQIPIAAGLAGGSSNAAATLIALNELWNLALPKQDLAALALALGSDVPFCLTGGAMAATGRGEVLEPLEPIGQRWLVLVHPPLAVTAAHAYGHPLLTRNLVKPVAGKTPAFRAALAAIAEGRVAETVCNRMASGIFHDHPELRTIVERLLDYGCDASAMSGSGPTLFGLCGTEEQARTAAAGFEDYPVSIVQMARSGVLRFA